jgi:hypothetical protein
MENCKTQENINNRLDLYVQTEKMQHRERYVKAA